MKKKLLFILLFICIGISAQNLSMSDLKTIRQMSITEVRSTLEGKGWKYTAEDTKNGLSSMKFIYTPAKDSEDKVAFMTVYYSEFVQNAVYMQFHQPLKFKEYMTTLNTSKMTLSDNGMDKFGGAYNEFRDDDASITITSNTRKDSNGVEGPVFLLTLNQILSDL